MTDLPIDAEGALLMAAAFFLGGVIAMPYGGHLWGKITFVMWTRQALREYGAPSRYEPRSSEPGDEVSDQGTSQTKKRGFVTRTLGGPGGFKPGEVPEYLTRKAIAIALIAGGILLLLSVVFMYRLIPLLTHLLMWEDVSGLWVLIPLTCGVVIAAYGEHLWSKVTHILWTRQALREYGAPSQREGFSFPKHWERRVERTGRK